jgi:glycosyltransferase involved in cell wall biosynthesis
VLPVKKIHVCNTTSNSGIARYAEDFFNVVLRPCGFIQMSPECVTNELLATLLKDTAFHLELGNGQFAERDSLKRLIATGFNNIDVTIHDAPWITFPFYRSDYSIINQISKAFDWYLNTAGATGRLLQRCRHVYVLSRQGKDLLEKRHGLTNVYYIPHVIDPQKIWNEPLTNDCKDILYFGFIGAKKGLEYALELHSEIRKNDSGIRMYVIGQVASSKAQCYFDRLKVKYFDGVSYLGFVPESELDDLFSKVGHLFLPFLPYKYWCPCSGTILGALRRGRIVWTNPVNAIPETIHDGVNGLFLSGDVRKDAKQFTSITSQRADVLQLSNAAIQTCHKMHEELIREMSEIDGGTY